MKKFILLSARRSGTTFFLRALDSHPQITVYKKAFGIVTKLRYIIVDRPSGEFYEFRTASNKRKFDYIFRRKQIIDHFFETLPPDDEEVKVVGVRLTYGQAKKHPEILAWALENDVGILHLVRENTLKVIVSRATARKRGMYHATSQDQVKKVTVSIPQSRVKRHLNMITAQTEKYRRLLKGKQHLEISYESLVKDWDTETDQALAFLNVDQGIPLTTNTVKINPNALEDILENYEDIAHSLKNTPFEKFLN